MRVSVDEADLGYIPYCVFKAERSRNPRVFLEGVELRDVITADNIEGLVIRYKRSRNDRLVVVGDTLLTETLYGLVLIE